MSGAMKHQKTNNGGTTMEYRTTGTESQEQQTLFQWAAIKQRELPELALLHHIPNGGQRARTTAARLKAEGVKAGVPDLSLPVPRGNFNGLYVEMKVAKNKPTANQVWWLNALTQQGYCTAVCYSWQEAANVIEKYLKSNKE